MQVGCQSFSGLPVSLDIFDCFVLAVRQVDQSIWGFVMCSWGNRLVYAGCQWCKYFIVVLIFLLISCYVYLFFGVVFCLIVEQGLVNLLLMTLWVVSVGWAGFF